jgi:hypothetical protein
MKTNVNVNFLLVVLLIVCPNILWAEFVPVENARRVAVNHMNKSIQVKALKNWQAESPQDRVEPAALPKLTEDQITQTFTTAENDTPMYYVFNFSPEGWAIISADDVAYPVIAYSDTGVYDHNDSNQPPAFKAWMKNVAAEIADAVAKNLQPLPDAVEAWKQFGIPPDFFDPDLDEAAAAASVGPLIKSCWGQGWAEDCWPWDNDSYNRFCPWEYTDWTHICRDYCPTGCVATAFAQIMKYWQWPPVGKGYHGYDPPYDCEHECSGFGWREANFGEHYYNWSESFMPWNRPSVPIALLMSDIGVAVQMNYTPSGSGAYMSRAAYAYRSYFRYKATYDLGGGDDPGPVWVNKLKTELDSGRPMLYRGAPASSVGGHAFICDGYDLSGSFHFNWGWDGSYDGWYILNALTPGSHNYSKGQAAILGIEPDYPSEVYVDDDYTLGGSNDGHAWFYDAFDNIHDAINMVTPQGTVYVAAGTYYETVDFKGKAIHLYGTQGAGVTIIDGTGHTHVIQCVTGEDAGTVIEGFTIIGGSATGGVDNSGGGMYNVNSNPTVRHCTFSANAAGYGGGAMYNYQANPIVAYCKFTDNTAYSGGAICNHSSSPAVANCTFTENSGEYDGGGISDCNSSPTVRNCTFTANSAYRGAGMSNYGRDSSPTVIECYFRDNIADWGAGIENYDHSSPTVINCNFTGNSADHSGGGIGNDQSSPAVTNCSFSGNSAHWGAGIQNSDHSNPTVTNCTFTGNLANYNGGAMDSYRNSKPTVTNCILWGDWPDEISDLLASTSVSFSDIRAGWPGAGNIDADPRFVSPGCWVDLNDPNVIVEPNDPNAVWIEGDYRLLPGSPCIDSGDDTALPPDIADLDGDSNTTEPIPYDLDGNPRLEGCGVDMGAYEFSAHRLAVRARGRISYAADRKAEVLQVIRVAMEKEQQAYDALGQMLQSRNYGGWKIRDIAGTRQRLSIALSCEKNLIKMLQKSIVRLDDAATVLNSELQVSAGSFSSTVDLDANPPQTSLLSGPELPMVYLLGVLAAKNGALKNIDAVIEVEQQAYETLEQVLPYADCYGWNIRNIIKAKQKVFLAIWDQKCCRRVLNKSIETLKGSLRALGAPLTITFDEVPPGTQVDRMAIDGVKFRFSSADAIVLEGGLGGTQYIQPPCIEGDGSGTLTIDFDQPVFGVSYCFVLNILQPTPNATKMVLYDSGMAEVDTFFADADDMGFYYIEGINIGVSTIPIARAVITFAPTAQRFAFDNLTYCRSRYFQLEAAVKSLLPKQTRDADGQDPRPNRSAIWPIPKSALPMLENAQPEAHQSRISH